jgi:hypothetical protein
MIGKKINQLATELAPVSTDLTIIGDPTTGVSKKITLAQLGAIFSGAVSFYTNLAGFPATGDINVIYCAKDTQKLYLWSGSAYVEVFPSQALLDTYQLRSEKGNANGYASLDSQGKVPISQLPSSIMEYKGTWNASTNTPTLANGTGDTGDVYICNVAGTVNFGAGAITFAVGDYVIYSGTIWQRSSGAVGTVTSVALTVGGDAISVSGSPVTTSGTLALAFSGTTSQYIRGNGTLANFPTSLVTGTGTIYSLTKWGFTSGNIINSNLFDTGSVIYNNNATAGAFAVQFNGNTTTGLSYGLLINAGTNASDIALRVQNASSTSEYFFVYGDGKVQINNIPNATIDTDRFIVSDSGVIKYRTGAELLSDIGGASASGYVPYTGATANLDLGTHTLLAKDLVINHSSGSGVAASITKGGNGEALTVVKSSGSGNAASITGGVTLLDELHLNTDLADAYIASATNWNTAYSLRITSATSPLSITSNVISIAQASGSTNGYLSSTDWTTFNNKQNALTNPVTGTGTTNYLPKFTGTSSIGNSLVFDNGTNVGIGTATPYSATNYKFLTIDGTNGSGYVTRVGSINSFLSYSNSAGTTLSEQRALPIVFETTGTSRMTLDASGNLGLGVTPSAWGSNRSAIQFGALGAVFSDNNVTSEIGANVYISTAPAYTYITSNFATRFAQINGQFQWHQAASGTAGNAISFTQAMTLDASGRLGIGTTSPQTNLQVYQTGGAGNNYVEGTIQVGGTSSTLGGAFSYAAQNSGYVNITNLNNGGGANSRISFGFGAITSGLPANNVMTINQSGSVGIGTTSPSQKLEVAGIIRGEAVNVYGSSDPASTSPYLFSPSTGALGIGANGSERMRITSGGNVGIGTTNPVYKFVVSKGGAEGIEFDAGSIIAGKNYIINYNRSTSAYTDFEIAANNTIFSTAGSERMRITSGGNLLVNRSSDLATGSSTSRLVVNGAVNVGSAVGNTSFGSKDDGGLGVYVGSGANAFQVWDDNQFSYPRFIVQRAGNVGIGTTSPTQQLETTARFVIGNSVTGRVGIFGQNTATSDTYITLQNSAGNFDWGTSSGGHYFYGIGSLPMQFFTNSTERMRITSGGDVLLGTTGLTVGARLQLKGAASASAMSIDVGTNGYPAITFQNSSGSQQGYIVTNASSVQYLSISDYRLKQDFKDFNGLDLLTKIKTYDYEWKTDKTRSYGVIAHELQSIINYAVYGVKDGKEMQGVDYSKIVPVLIKAIQELNDKIK